MDRNSELEVEAINHQIEDCVRQAGRQFVPRRSISKRQTKSDALRQSLPWLALQIVRQIQRN